MNVLTDTKDVASIGGIPQGSGVTQVGLRGEEKFEGDVGRRRRVGEEGVRLVVGGNCRANGLSEFSYQERVGSANVNDGINRGRYIRHHTLTFKVVVVLSNCVVDFRLNSR